MRIQTTADIINNFNNLEDKEWIEAADLKHLIRKIRDDGRGHKCNRLLASLG